MVANVVPGARQQFEETWRRFLTATPIAVVVVIVDQYVDLERYTLTTPPFVRIGVTLGIFLGFRNSASDDWSGKAAN